MAYSKTYVNAKGETKTWYSPKSKCEKYKADLKSGKDTVTGKELTKGGACFRIGYRTALGQMADLHNLKTGQMPANKRK